MYKRLLLILLLILLIINITLSQKILKIPFKKLVTSQYFPNQENPIANKYMSQLVVEMSVGTPPQKLNCSLILNSFYSLFLSHEIPDITFPSYYNKTSSQTYNCTQKEKYYWQEDFGDAETFIDTIQIFDKNNKMILNNNFSFLLIDGLGYNVPNEFYAPGLIGLRLRKDDNKNQIDENRFLYKIKKYGLTNSETFYFDFWENEDEDNGNLVIGEELFDNDNYLIIYTGQLRMPDLGHEWSFNFDNIYYGEEEISDKDSLIKTENGLTVGPKSYEDVIKEFFKNESQCFLNYTKMGYATFKYYTCDIDFNESNMKDLIFELKTINYKFVFKPKDLFFIENNNKYFKIVFLLSLSDNQPYWYLGRNFLKKYKIRFDTERKSIYIPLKSEIAEKKKNSIFKSSSFWIIVSLGIIILGLIIFIIIYLKKYPRKKRANELQDDDYDYSQKNDNNLNENIN